MHGWLDRWFMVYENYFGFNCWIAEQMDNSMDEWTNRQIDRITNIWTSGH